MELSLRSSRAHMLCWPLRYAFFILRAGLYTNVVASIVALISLACGYWILGGLILLVQV